MSTNAGVEQGFGDVRANLRQGLAGDWVEFSNNNEDATGLNSIPQARQTQAITVSDPGDDVNMSVIVNGTTVEINTGVGNDLDDIGALLVAAINANAVVRGAVIPSFSSPTLTLTAKLPNQAFTISVGGTGLTLSTATAAVPADAIPFGRALIFGGFESGDSGFGDRVGLAKSVRFTAQVATIAGYAAAVGDAGSVITVIEVRGADRIPIRSVPVGGTDLTADTGLLNAALPADTVVVTESGADMVFTAEIAGFEFDVEITSTGSTAVLTNTTGPNRSTSFHKAFLGVSLFRDSVESSGVGVNTAVYRPNEGVAYASRGRVWTELSVALTGPSDVWVELADGDDSGRFFTAASSTRVRASRDVLLYERSAKVATDNLAVLRVAAQRR